MTTVRLSQLRYELWLHALGTYWADYRLRMPCKFDGSPMDLRDVYATIAGLTR